MVTSLTSAPIIGHHKRFHAPVTKTDNRRNSVINMHRVIKTYMTISDIDLDVLSPIYRNEVMKDIVNLLIQNPCSWIPSTDACRSK